MSRLAVAPKREGRPLEGHSGKGQQVDSPANVSAAEGGTRSNLGLDGGDAPETGYAGVLQVTVLSGGPKDGPHSEGDAPRDRVGCGLRGRGPHDWLAGGDGAEWRTEGWSVRRRGRAPLASELRGVVSWVPPPHLL
ncbi:hypothetical protein NDU88_007343 [Pleurodeles waltl]|uniref:Uncharacterized protein n=1 Tax=Pleurodeles waltl TaxID=8319 RepID=A0AAV7NT00_PLEWA|nr:hypothetical protein NDU88_007343 [Pleurodeles waltl]